MLSELSHYLNPEMLSRESTGQGTSTNTRQAINERRGLWGLRGKSKTISRFLEAAAKGDMAAVIWRLQEGIDCNVKDYDGRNVLHTAAANGRAGIAKMLLEKFGAEPLEINARDRWGRTPLDEAHAVGDASLAAVIERFGGEGGGKAIFRRIGQGYQAFVNGPYEAIWAARYGFLRLLNGMSAQGADICGADGNGRSALHLAAAEGHYFTAVYLLDQGADACAPDRWGNTPLMDAERKGHSGVIQLLRR